MKFHHEIEFLLLAKQIARNSKDPSRKIGAIAVSDDSRRLILSTGWNGFPRSIEDTYDRLHSRETKYKYTIHAEMNMIFNACYNGVSLVNSHVFVYGLPVCSKCALALIQVGVGSVISQVDEDIHEPWLSEWKLSSELFSEANIPHLLWNSHYEEIITESHDPQLDSLWGSTCGC